MSHHDYQQSRYIVANEDNTFTALVMAAMRKADTHNTMLLRVAFPSIYAELDERYNTPNGAAKTDPVTHHTPINHSLPQNPDGL